MNDAILAGGSAQPLQEAERKALTLRAWLGFIAMIFGNFMAILDIQIVASSLNEIQAGLSASADEISWVQTGYLIAEVIAIPLSGYLSRLLSTRVYFVISALGFTLASLGCALSWNLASMTIFRVIQGFLGGGMIPSTLSALFIMFPGQRERIMPQVLVGMVSTMGPTIGPTIGGYLTAAFSWHWLFLINLVPGLLVSLAAWNLVRIDKPDWSLVRDIDKTGLLLMALFLGTLEYVLEQGPTNDWLSDPLLAWLALISLLTGIGFFWRTFTSEHPLLVLRVFHNRNFALSCVVAFMLGAGLYGMIYLLPLFFGRVRGYDAMQIGQVMMVSGAAMFLAAPFAGKLARLMDLRLMFGIGLILVGISAWMNTHLTSESGYWELFAPQVIRGFGMIFAYLPMTNLSMGTLEADEMKNASGIYNLMRNLGGALGLAIIGTLMQWREAFHYSHLSSALDISRAIVRETVNSTGNLLGATLGPDAGHRAALDLLAMRVNVQALTLTFNDMFMLMAVMFLIASVAPLFLDKPVAELPADSGAH
ncbi:MAG: DHA2 family efflux MFS transporter permease subunit [Stenotrophobium sp.]